MQEVIFLYFQIPIVSMQVDDVFGHVILVACFFFGLQIHTLCVVPRCAQCSLQTLLAHVVS